ncbi:hypothetical protein ACWDBO_44035 [Streptomyces mirabilis]|uniref:hypothetical protein n=1 Tax=Streptomyces TaxID=1883 RepID=UPI0029BF21C9|nr:hypothetical protein [Streptomyces sp. AK02-04a]MDX3755278.1 hypothetical protein [Streptomyces sp. AK02-04a]
MVLFLLLALVAVVLGIAGVAAEGLGYLLIIGIGLLAADAAVANAPWSPARRPSPHPLTAGNGRPHVRHAVELASP